jgi:hypothetical protein
MPNITAGLLLDSPFADTIEVVWSLRGMAWTRRMS